MTTQQLVRIVLLVSTTFHEVTCQRENIAFKKSTEQTPGTFQEHYSDLAVDGNDDSNVGGGSCSHTSGSHWNSNEAKASWKVFLGGMFPVTGIVIVNRDIYKERTRLMNFMIYGSIENKTLREIYDDNSKNAYTNAKIHIPLDGSVLYSTITVNLPKHKGYPDDGDSYLTLCEVKIYAAPPKCNAHKAQVPNGHIYIDGNSGILVNQKYTVGTLLKVNCDRSFHLNGSSVLQCLPTGEYNYSNFPNCLEICQPLQKPRFVFEIRPAMPFYLVGDVVTIICEYGYKTVSKNQAICQNGGIWDIGMSIPSCQSIKCPEFKIPDNGRHIIIDKPRSVPYDSDLGTEISVVCNTGYESVDARKRVCQSNGTWSGQETICILVLCKNPGNISNGAYVFKNGSEISKGDTTKFSYNTSLKTSCNEGYTLHGQVQRTCKSDKTWSSMEPYCDIVTCKFPGLYENGNYTIRNKNITEKGTSRSYISGHMNFSTEIEAICFKGYILNSTDFIRRCTSNGSWTGENPVCAQVICRWPLKINNGYYKASRNETIVGMPYSTTLTAFCIGNYKLREEYKTRRCNGSGVWDEEPAICTLSIMQTHTSADVGLISGISAIVVVLLVVVVLTFFLYRRHKKLQNNKNKQPLQFSSLQRKETASNNTAITPGYEYAEVHKINPVKASRKTANRTPAKSNASEIYSTAVIEETLKPSFPSSGSLQSDQAYYSFSEAGKLPATAVEVKDLSELILTRDDARKKYQTEFENLPQGMVEPHTEALKLGNRGKNRYRNLYAYDDTHVVLDTEDGSKSKSDYINACYVHGFNKTRKYIASQGPTTEIIDDFWRMIWQTSCSKIVMLTHLVEEGKVKCEQYWPDSGIETYDKIKVEIQNTERFSQFVIRTLIVQKENSSKRTIHQFHFTAWPDRGVPKYASSLVQFLSKVRYSPSYGNGPVVVHCSAGVGRTGTFIALDNVTEQGKALGYVDVAGVVEAMRKQRVSSVQTLDQYIFVYHSVVETLMLSTASIPAAKFPKGYQELLQIDTRTRRKKIHLEFETLKKMSPVATESEYVSSKLVRNRRKNRYSNVLPIEEFMPTLTKMDGSEETDYINAVFLPSYKDKKAFIITQAPMESTIEDFWRLVWEHEIHTLVMMNSREEMTESEVYWPNVNESVTLDNIVISNDGVREMNGHKVLTFSAKKFLVTRGIRIFQYRGWNRHKTLPESPDAILSAMDLVQSWQQQTGNHTVLVHCMNGVDKSGLFCVISAVIERMKIEQDVAITHVIEEMRNAREQIIPSVEQYQFCHEAVLAFIKLYDTYSNFTG